jgi:hypothetical protein
MKELDLGLWQMEQKSQNPSPFDFSQLVSSIMEAPRTVLLPKKNRPIIRPTVSAQLHMFNDRVRALAEGFVFQLLDDIMCLNETVSTQTKGDDPLLDQISEIRKGSTRLRKAKKAVLLFKNNMESDGSIRDARVEIREL